MIWEGRACVARQWGTQLTDLVRGLVLRSFETVGCVGGLVPHRIVRIADRVGGLVARVERPAQVGRDLDG